MSKKVLITEQILTNTINAIINVSKHQQGTLANYIDRSITSFENSAITNIGENAFNSYETLTTVSLPNATSIGFNAFGYCSALTAVSLPNVTSIGDYAFCDNLALTTISLPKATSIGDHTFSYSSALTEIHFAKANQATIEALSGYSSKFGAKNATIYFDL